MSIQTTSLEKKLIKGTKWKPLKTKLLTEREGLMKITVYAEKKIKKFIREKLEI